MQLESRFIANIRLIAPDTDQHGFYELEQLRNNFLRYLQRVEAIKFAHFYFPCFPSTILLRDTREMFPKGKRFAKENEEAEIIGIFDACFWSFFLSAFTFDLWG